MKNEYLPTMAAFIALVLGIAYIDVAMWFKVLVVVSGVIMMILSAVVIAGTTAKNSS